jgi:hypothetical protein
MVRNLKEGPLPKGSGLFLFAFDHSIQLIRGLTKGMSIRNKLKVAIMVAAFVPALPACLNFHFGHSPAGLWFYSYSSDPAQKGMDSLVTAGTLAAGLTPASWLELKPGGGYTREFGKFEYGVWSMKDNKLQLTNQLGKTSVYHVNYSSSDDIRVLIEQGVEAHFENHPLPDTTKGADPFSAERNRWRLPAREKETEADIRRRLLNHFQFWEAYFTWALNDNISSVDVRSTPTLLKIYGNGFVLKSVEDLPPEWRSIFFDAADCVRANNLMENLFHSRTIAWAHTDNKYKLFIGAFQQMQEWLR